MKNDTNIYDIDGNLIRAAGDNHKFTLEEVEEMVDKAAKRMQENPDNDTYKVYYNNLQSWLFKMYNEMSKEDIAKRLTILQSSIQEAKDKQNEAEQAKLDKVNNAIEELKEQAKPVVMDEYVQFEEMPTDK